MGIVIILILLSILFLSNCNKKNEQLKQDNELIKQLKQENILLRSKVAQLEANSYNNDTSNNKENNNMNVCRMPHGQKRQKVSRDEEPMDGDDSDGGLPPHLLELICRLVIRCLAKHLPAQHEELVALSTATGLCNDDDVARLRDSLGCRRQLLSFDPYHCAGVMKHVSYNMSGTQIVSVRDHVALIWDAKTGKWIGCFQKHECFKYFNHASFNPRGDLIVTACGDDTARVWSLRTEECLRILRGHTATVNTASYSHDGEWIVTASYDGTVRVWNALTDECVRVLRHNDGTVFWSALYSPDDSMIVTTQYDEEDGECVHTACLWDAATGECRRMLKGYTQPVTSASFSPDGSLVAAASDDKTARIWKVETGECIHILQGHEDCVRSALFSPDGAHIVTASWDGTVRLWDAADGRQLFLYDVSVPDWDPNADPSFVPFACYDPKGTRILVTLDDSVQVLSAPVFRFK